MGRNGTATTGNARRQARWRERRDARWQAVVAECGQLRALVAQLRGALVAWEADARAWDAAYAASMAEAERLGASVARLRGELAQARARPELDAAMRVVLAQCGADVQAVVERLAARERGLPPAQVVREVLGDWVKTRWA